MQSLIFPTLPVKVVVVVVVVVVVRKEKGGGGGGGGGRRRKRRRFRRRRFRRRRGEGGGGGGEGGGERILGFGINHGKLLHNGFLHHVRWWWIGLIHFIRIMAFECILIELEV